MNVRVWLDWILKRHPTVAVPVAPVPASPLSLPDSLAEPVQICNPRVLLVILNPLMDPSAGSRLGAEMSWPRPDDLARRFVAEILQASAGFVRYQIVQRVELDEFPVLVDGFRYDPDSYRSVMRREVQAHNPSVIDYRALLDSVGCLPRIEAGQLDEVWVMGFPHAGLYESIMGGAGAFWCNAPPLIQTAGTRRRFVVMGFSFERDLGEMLHSYNHRAEAILAHVFNSLGFLTWAYKANRTPATLALDQKLNLFERYLLFDLIAPGQAGLGTVHYAPNALRDYDLGGSRLVASCCYDWLRFPEFRGDVRMVSSAEWGGGSERAYQRWWMDHLPKSAGRQNGIHNNWWQYISNLDSVAQS